jgi:hypothetical protein
MTGPSVGSQNYSQSKTQYSNYYPQKQSSNFQMDTGYAPLDTFETDLMGGL